MARRRALMMMPHGLDTTPVIETYGYKITGANSTVQDNEYGITKIYDYPKVTYTLTMVTTLAGNRILIYKDGKYMDWWFWGSESSKPFERNCINIDSNGIQLCMRLANIANAYAYFKETGQILYAGKNTPYYGHLNISELN